MARARYSQLSCVRMWVMSVPGSTGLSYVEVPVQWYGATTAGLPTGEAEKQQVFQELHVRISTQRTITGIEFPQPVEAV